jgi:hypothetical protein
MPHIVFSNSSITFLKQDVPQLHDLQPPQLLIALAISPSIFLLVELAKTMCEGLKTRFTIRSIGNSMMQAKKLRT